MATESVELLQGTLDLLVLKTLSWGPTHGYGIARWIQDTTGDVLQIEEGSLYPALHRLEKRGWIAAEWGSRKTTAERSIIASRRAGGSSFAPSRRHGPCLRRRCRRF